MCRIASSMIMKIKVIRTLHSYISCERKLGTGYIRSSYVGLWILSSSSLMAEWDSGHGNAAAIAGNASTGMALLAVGRGLPSQTYGAERRGQLSRWPFSGVNFGALCFPRPSALVQPPHEAAQPSCEDSTLSQDAVAKEPTPAARKNSCGRKQQMAPLPCLLQELPSPARSRNRTMVSLLNYKH